MKYLIITTFPNKDWHDYLHVCTISHLHHFPVEIPLLIKLVPDELQQTVEQSLDNLVKSIQTDKQGRKLHIETKQSGYQKDFYSRHKDYPKPESYRTNYIDFSHKIFALYDAYKYAKAQEVDYIIWLDADIIAKEEISLLDIEKWHNNADIAYLGRKDWDHSECGLVIYKTETAGEFIEAFHRMYVSDEALKQEQHHDSYIFDRLREKFPSLKYHNISEGVEGRDVFNISMLGAKLTHCKGPIEKKKLLEKVQKIRNGTYNPAEARVVNVNDITIKTKNCVNKDSIRDNISKNIRLIRNWYAPCKKTDEVVILASAGPSLDLMEVRQLYDCGLKVVAVKHAIKPLRLAGIIPWAVILLDPRSHVGDFIDDIHPDSIVFVASMVDPEVVEKLLDRKMKVIGYHVAVGANEVDFLSNGDCLIVGGSATATRGISVLEGLGFRNMELFGYDCSYHEKPNLQEKKDNDTLKYEEVTLEVETYGDKKIKRTFWTEGQFLAQLQEFRNYYYHKKELNLNIHGDGMIAWVWRNKLAHRKYCEEKDAQADLKALELNDYLNRLNLNG